METSEKHYTPSTKEENKKRNIGSRLQPTRGSLTNQTKTIAGYEVKPPTLTATWRRTPALLEQEAAAEAQGEVATYLVHC